MTLNIHLTPQQPLDDCKQISDFDSNIVLVHLYLNKNGINVTGWLFSVMGEKNSVNYNSWQPIK